MKSTQDKLIGIVYDVHMSAELDKVTFNKTKCDFSTSLKERVTHFLKENCIGPKANLSSTAKSIFFVLLCASTYGVIITSTHPLVFISAFAFMGLIGSFATMNIIHDALHGSLSSNAAWNRFCGFFMDLFGVSSYYWKKGHVVEHHTFTNIVEHDADLKVPFILRLSKEQKLYPIHKFQHLYAPLLYCFNIVHWMYVSDFKRLYRIFTKKAPMPKLHETVLMVLMKGMHTFLFIALPILLTPISWWICVLGYFGQLATAGLILTTIFQLAHIVEEVEFPLPNDAGEMEYNFMRHQIETTSNFARGSKLVGFLFGGLNFQIEHHLFPYLCHVHLKKIAPIVEKTALEFGISYHQHQTFFEAIKSHFRTLKRLGSS